MRRPLEVFRSLRSGPPALAAVRDEDGELQLLHAVVRQALELLATAAERMRHDDR